MAGFIELRNYIINTDHVVFVQKEGTARIVALSDGKRIPLEAPRDFGGGDVGVDGDGNLVIVKKEG